jgi:glycogen(starch) synthase
VTSPKPLIIATEAAGSGMGRFAVELANALQAAGHPITLIAPAQPYALRVARNVNIARPAAPGGWRKMLGLARQSLAVAAAVWREAGPGRPVLLIHIAATLPVSLAPIVAARLKRARLVLGLHDFYPHTPRFPPALRAVERWLYRAAYRRCDLVITNNEAQTRRLMTEAKLPARRVCTLYHGPFVVAGLTLGDPQAELRLLIFGSLRPNKRVLESICAVRQLRAQGARVSLRIAGAPRREDAAYWARCCAEIPPDDPGFQVRPHFIADDELPAVLSGVDAMLCPYAGFDSQSGVAVTGVSNALPVIATAAVRVAHVTLAAAPWPQVADCATPGAIAAGVRGFMAIPASTRQAFADELQARFLAAAGWESLAAHTVAAMHEREFWP